VKRVLKSKEAKVGAERSLVEETNSKKKKRPINKGRRRCLGLNPERLNQERSKKPLDIKREDEHRKAGWGNGYLYPKLKGTGVETANARLSSVGV